MRFTKEELESAGWPTFSAPVTDHWWSGDVRAFRGYGETRDRCLDALLRLSLAHPERAALALGEGWSAGIHAGGSHFTWCAPIFGLHLRVAEGQVQLSASGVTLPPEFLGAFQRAYRIAAAWQRIQQQGGAK